MAIRMVRPEAHVVFLEVGKKVVGPHENLRMLIRIDDERSRTLITQQEHSLEQGGHNGR